MANTAELGCLEDSGYTTTTCGARRLWVECKVNQLCSAVAVGIGNEDDADAVCLELGYTPGEP